MFVNDSELPKVTWGSRPSESTNMTDRARGISIHRPIIYGTSAYPLTPEDRTASKINPDYTHRWTVAVRSASSIPGDNAPGVGGADDISYFIKRVTFRLHETYPNPNRNIDKPPFEVTETGWGEFEIGIRITFVQEAGEKPINFSHNLKLHPWVMPDTSAEPTKDPALLWAGPPQPKIIANADGSTSTIPAPTIDPEPVHSWQYDEITFTDPPKAFLDILMSHPPTPLPKHTSSKKRPLPPNVAHVQSLGWATNRGGAVPEFTERLERDEAERLDAAKRAVIDATEVLRASLIEKEKELESLRRQVNHE